VGSDVPEASDVKYRAFLSYAHSDAAWAKWLHSHLEAFAIDKDLVGRETAQGPVPEALRPIFRDREDFSGGHSLTDATIAALDASAALVVLCSPVAADRRAVNEEVQLFRGRHPGRPVVPVVIDGTWPENFPAALRYHLSTDGSISNRPITILGPDLREEGDGKGLGLAKVVAGLTGLSPDDLFRRTERARRKQNRLRAAYIGVFLAVSLASGFFYWLSHERQRTVEQQQSILAEVSDLVDKYSLVNSANAAVPGAREGLTQAITAIAEGSATDPRYAKALDLLKNGKPAEAEPLLRSVAEEKSRRADKDAKDAAAAYRNLASIAGVSEPARAREYYAEAARLDPSDVEGMYQHAWHQMSAGQLDIAVNAFARVLAIAKPGKDDRSIYWSKLLSGDIEMTRNNYHAAIAMFSDAVTIAYQMVEADPGNAAWQENLEGVYQRIGWIQQDFGHLGDALDSHRRSLAISERLVKADMANPRLQNTFSISLTDVGRVLEAQGNLADALNHYRYALAIRKILNGEYPRNTTAKYNLAESFDKVGDVLLKQGDLTGAFTSYSDSLSIRDRLAKTDLGNTEWQSALSISHRNVGNVQMQQGDLTAALTSYHDSHAIADRVAKAHPDNTSYQSRLFLSYEKLGGLQLARREFTEALAIYGDSFAIAERLAKAYPENNEWQFKLSNSLGWLGDVQEAQGDLGSSLNSYRDSLIIVKRLNSTDGSNEKWRTSFELIVDKIGSLAYRLVLARDYNNALVAADQAISNAPNKIWLYSNRAHALMFAKQSEVARQLYFKYHEAKSVMPDGRAWDTVILDDFTDLRKHGLSDPLMGEVERQFNSPR
jgi:tetratricopeptide (TPR) repeat protein